MKSLSFKSGQRFDVNSIKDSIANTNDDEQIFEFVKANQEKFGKSLSDCIMTQRLGFENVSNEHKMMHMLEDTDCTIFGLESKLNLAIFLIDEKK